MLSRPDTGTQCITHQYYMYTYSRTFTSLRTQTALNVRASCFCFWIFLRSRRESHYVRSCWITKRDPFSILHANLGFGKCFEKKRSDHWTLRQILDYLINRFWTCVIVVSDEMKFQIGPFISLRLRHRLWLHSFHDKSALSFRRLMTFTSVHTNQLCGNTYNHRLNTSSWFAIDGDCVHVFEWFYGLTFVSFECVLGSNASTNTLMRQKNMTFSRSLTRERSHFMQISEYALAISTRHIAIF